MSAKSCSVRVLVMLAISMTALPVLAFFTGSVSLSQAWISTICFNRYFSPRPANLGKLGAGLLPSAPWQAPQTAALALPAVASPSAQTACETAINPRVKSVFCSICFMELSKIVRKKICIKNCWVKVSVNRYNRPLFRPRHSIPWLE